MRIRNVKKVQEEGEYYITDRNEKTKGKQWHCVSRTEPVHQMRIQNFKRVQEGAGMTLRIEMNTKGNQQNCFSRSETVREMRIWNLKRVEEGTGMTLWMEMNTKGGLGVKDIGKDHNVSCSSLGPVCAHQNIRSQIWHLTWWSTQIFSNGHIGKLSGGLPINHAQQEKNSSIFFLMYWNLGQNFKYDALTTPTIFLFRLAQWHMRRKHRLVWVSLP